MLRKTAVFLSRRVCLICWHQLHWSWLPCGCSCVWCILGCHCVRSAMVFCDLRASCAVWQIVFVFVAALGTCTEKTAWTSWRVSVLKSGLVHTQNVQKSCLAELAFQSWTCVMLPVMFHPQHWHQFVYRQQYEYAHEQNICNQASKLSEDGWTTVINPSIEHWQKQVRKQRHQRTANYV